MKRIVAALAVAFAAACSSPMGQSASVPGPQLRAARPHSGSSPIQHVIVIMQENRSFDNLFEGFPGANTASSGQGKGGKVYPLVQVPLIWTWDMRHDHTQFLEDFDHGNVDGFNNQIKTFKTGTGCSDPINHPKCWIVYTGPNVEKMAYAYVDPNKLKPYWTLAQQYALGDDTFSSNSGPSFVSHQFMIAAQAGHSSEVPDGQPWGCNNPYPSTTVEILKYGKAQPPVFSKATGHEVVGPFPCFTYPTIADLLDTARVSWRYYTASKGSGANLSAFMAIQQIYTGPDWKNVVSPDTRILKDIADGNLQQVSWVTPTGQKSDHSGRDSGDKGPSWVASIVNAVGQSQYWNSTAIVIMWDEWGGWYDHVVPPQVPDTPGTGAYEGLGFRVPVIVVSPYAKAGYVSHKQYEIASTLSLIEETFGLPSLGLADARTTGFDDMFNFSQKPRRFKAIPATYNARYFLAHTDATPGDSY